MARRPRPSFRALLFRCGEGAVCEPSRLEDRQQRASFLVGSESNVRHWGPWPAGPVRASGPCCFGVAKAPFVSLRGWKTAQRNRQLRELVFLSVQKATLGTGGRGPQARSVLQGPAVSVWRRRRLWAFAAGRQTAQRASFFVGSESNVRQWEPWPAGPVRPSGPCCFGVAKAPFVSLCGWKTDSSES